MSINALLRATRDYLQEVRHYTREQCAVMAGARPPAVMGDMFVAIHEASWDDWQSNGLSWDYVLSLHVTVTFRVSPCGPLEFGERYICPETGGLNNECIAIASVLHCDPFQYRLLRRANQYVKGNENNGFIEPLQMTSGGRLTEAGGNWIGAQDNGTTQFLWRTLTFGKARRIQVIENQT